MAREIKHAWGQIGSAHEFFRLRNMAGVLGRIVRCGVEKNNAIPKHVEAIDKLMGRLAILNQVEPRRSPKIESLYSTVGTWHGTGRRQHRNGEIIDVLDAIIKKGYIATHEDTFDMNGPIKSASVARSRMYARTYADLYRHNPNEENRHGTSLFWGWTFLTDTMIEAVLEAKMWTPQGYGKIRKHFGNNQLLRWCDRITVDPGVNVLNVYRKGSDIPGNHPVVFGIREGSFEPAPTSRTIAAYETRTEDPLTLQYHITHVEVPADNEEEVRHKFAASEHVLPVVSIEEAEHYAANFPFSALLLGNTAVNS